MQHDEFFNLFIIISCRGPAVQSSVPREASSFLGSSFSSFLFSDFFVDNLSFRPVGLFLSGSEAGV